MYKANYLYRLLDVTGALARNAYGATVMYKTEVEAIEGATMLITSERYNSLYLMKMVKAVTTSRPPPVVVEDVE